MFALFAGGGAGDGQGAQVKISFLIHNVYGLGGTNRTTINLAAALADRHDVEIVSVFRSRDAPLFDIDPRVKVSELIDTRVVKPEQRDVPARVFPAAETRYHQYSTMTDERAAEYFRTAEPDVAIGTRPGLNVYVARFASAATLRIGQEHITLESHPEELRAQLREHYGRLNAMVTVSEADAVNYRTRMAIPDLPIFAVPNSVAAPTLVATDPAAKVVIAAGRLAVVKRYDLLVRAFAKVVAKHPDWRLRIYGDGGQRGRLRALINELGLYDHVHLMGVAAPMEAEWVKGSIAAVTSESESFGMTIAEAMRGGLPVVSTDCPVGPREIINDGDDGLLVPPGDVDAICDGLLELIDDEGLRARMGAAARRNAERFAPAEIARRYEKLFRDLGAGGGAGGARPSVPASRWGRLLRPRRAARIRTTAARPTRMSGSVRAERDGVLHVTLGPAAPRGGRTLLLLRRDGRPKREALRIRLTPDAATGRPSARIGAELALGQGIWDLWIESARAPRRRLRSDLLDLRGLMSFEPPAQHSPVRALLPYPTVDGYIALSARAAEVHAEVRRVRVEDGAITVATRLFGTAARPEGFYLRHRHGRHPVVDLDWRRGPDELLRVDVPCAAVARHRAEETDLWDLWARIAGRDEPVRVGKWFGDVKNCKAVYVFPVTVVEDAQREPTGLRPYYTVDNDLSVNARGVPAGRPPVAAPRQS